MSKVRDDRFIKLFCNEPIFRYVTYAVPRTHVAVLTLTIYNSRRAEYISIYRPFRLKHEYLVAGGSWIYQFQLAGEGFISHLTTLYVCNMICTGLLWFSIRPPLFVQVVQVTSLEFARGNSADFCQSITSTRAKVGIPSRHVTCNASKLKSDGTWQMDLDRSRVDLPTISKSKGNFEYWNHESGIRMSYYGFVCMSYQGNCAATAHM